MATDIIRTSENNVSEVREYLFEKYCQSHGAEKVLPPFEKLLHYIRDPILAHKKRSDPGVWLFSSIKLPTRSADTLAGVPGMMIMRDFIASIVEHVRCEHATGATVPDLIMTTIFDMLVADKLRKDISEINENRKRMEKNSEKNLKEVLAEIAEESKEDQVAAAMTNNFSKICQDVKKELKPSVNPKKVEKRAEISTLDVTSPDYVTEKNNDDDDEENDAENLARAGVDEDDDDKTLPSSTNGSINGEALNYLLAKAATEKRERKQERAREKYEKKQKLLMSLAVEEQELLSARLDTYKVYGKKVELEKWKLYKLYGCFVSDISPRILAEMTFEQTTDPEEQLQTLKCTHQTYTLINGFFARLKPPRDNAKTELFERMAIKSFAFKAFYVYLYQISCVYADLYDSILRRELTKIDVIARGTSQFRGLLDHLVGMSFILKYFWGQVIFRQITPFDDTPVLECARMDPIEIRDITAMEIRTISVPDLERMAEEKATTKKKGLKYEKRYIFKTETVACTPYDVLVKFCRFREQFYLLFQTFILKTLPDKEIVAASLMYRSRNNPIRHIVLNVLDDNDFYEHEMWDVLGDFDPAVGHKLECIQNKTVMLLKFGEPGAEANKDLFLEMLNGFDSEVADYVNGKRHYISTLASLYVIFLVETYFTRHEKIYHVNANRFEETWATRYFLPRMHPDMLVTRISDDDEPFIVKLTGGMFMLRKPDNSFVVADVLTILHLYKTEVTKLGGILFFDERYPIDDFLKFLHISMHRLS